MNPGFENNHLVYLTWSGAADKGCATPPRAGPAAEGLRDFQVLFVATPFVKSANLFGSKLVFDDVKC